MRIIERKFRRTLGNIWVGYNDLDWLGNCIKKIVESNLNGDIFKHHRDGYKAIHVICCSNRNGNFFEVSEFHSGSR